MTKVVVMTRIGEGAFTYGVAGWLRTFQHHDLQSQTREETAKALKWLDNSFATQTETVEHLYLVVSADCGNED